MPGSSDIKTCPKCGALITPQLKKCRQCGAYLHGTSMEGFLVGLLPGNLREYPATGILALLILVMYALFVVLAGTDSVLGFSGYSLVQFGATGGSTLLQGQWWRLLTYQFVHHDVLHLAFNLWALMYAGRAVETLFDAKKMFLTYLLAGASGGALSFVYYVFVRNDVLFVSGGASGAVCGLIGAALIGARRLGPDGRDMFKDMLRWSLYMVVWGFMVPGINNAAHLGGFLGGAGLAYVIPVGLTQTVARQRLLSVIALAALGGVIAAFVWNFTQIRGQPLSLKNDAEPRRMLFFTYHEGHDIELSGNGAAWDRCIATMARTIDAERKRSGLPPIGGIPEGLGFQELRQIATMMTVTDSDVLRCEIAVKATPYHPLPYEILAAYLERRGQVERSKALLGVIERLPHSRTRLQKRPKDGGK